MFLKKLLVTAMLAASVLVYRTLPAASGEGPATEKAPPKQEKPNVIEVRSCRFVAYDSVEVFAQVPGQLKYVKADIGDRVRKGDVLAVIDSPDLVKDLELAKLAVLHADLKMLQRRALVEKARGELRGAETFMAQREAEVAVATVDQTAAAQHYERLKDLAKTGAVDQRSLDEAKAKWETARARIQAARIAIDVAKDEREVRTSVIRAAEAAEKLEHVQRESAQIGQDHARRLVELMRVTAPIDGVVTERKLGSFALLSAANKVPIVKISRTDMMKLVVPVAADDAPRVSPGMRVTIDIPSLAEKGLTAQVSRMSYAIDAKTSTMRVEVDLANPSGRILEGMSAGVRIDPVRVMPKAE